MFRNSIILSAFAFCVSAVITNAFCTEIPISKKLTLSDVLALGFRPSDISPYNLCTLRCWEKQDLILSFEDGFKYEIKAEQITFNVYDDDQIRSLEITGDRDHELRLDDAVKEAGFVFEKFGPVPKDLDVWLEDVRRKNMFSSFGHLVTTRHGIRVGVQLLPTLQHIDESPAIFGLKIEWPYLGSGPAGGTRMKPIVTPSGYDWDMSYQTWSKRIAEKGTSKLMPNLPNLHFPRFVWPILALIGIAGVLLAKWIRSRVSEKTPSGPL